MVELDRKLKIKSDRGSNKALRIWRGETHTFPAFWGEKYRISKPWTERNQMVLDVLTHLIFDYYKDKGQQERVFCYPDIETVKADEKLIHEKGPYPENECTTIEVEACVFRELTGKHYMTSKDILALFQDTASTRFIVNQPVLMKVQREIRSKHSKRVDVTKNGVKPKETVFLKDATKEEWVEYSWLTMPFEVGWDTKDPNPSMFKVRFSTIFGKVFVHNVRAKGYNLFDRRVYDLTGNAQNFYRYFILVEQGFRKKTHTDAYEEDIIEALDLHTPTVRRTIEGYIGELKGLKIIYSFQRMKDEYGKRFYRMFVSPKELGPNKKPDHDSFKSDHNSFKSDQTSFKSDQT
jgi:hypothetical protein